MAKATTHVSHEEIKEFKEIRFAASIFFVVVGGASSPPVRDAANFFVVAAGGSSLPVASRRGYSREATGREEPPATIIGFYSGFRRRKA